MKKKIIALMCTIIFMVLATLGIWFYQKPASDLYVTLHLTVESESPTRVETFFMTQDDNGDYDKTQGFTTQKSVSVLYDEKSVGQSKELVLEIPASTRILRIDPSEESAKQINISDVYIDYEDVIITNDFGMQDLLSMNQVSEIKEANGVITLTTGDDAYLTWECNADACVQAVRDIDRREEMTKKFLIIAVVDLLLLVIYIKIRQFMEIPLEVYRNKKLTLTLAKNDFKSRFAGSYLGIVWAFVQPIVTVIVYWFVFEKALNAGTQATKSGINAPYVLWLIAGLVPWFYFSEAINMATNTLVEYSYLVKKVVFNISILPIVKLISSLFVHVFFVAFMFIMYFVYGYAPTLYMLQVVYYSFAMFILCIGLVYATSAMMVFFRDLGQIVNILLQVGIWATPIMWNINTMTGISPIVLVILKLNPMFYIVSGYRDALLNNVWFWEKPGMTLYFWIFTVLVYMFGTTIFRKLKIHFADVL